MFSIYILSGILKNEFINKLHLMIDLKTALLQTLVWGAACVICKCTVCWLAFPFFLSEGKQNKPSI